MAHGRRSYYIGGFNVYFGLKERTWGKYYWLNIQGLCARLTLANQELVEFPYFTSRITGHEQDKRVRGPLLPS